MVNGKHFYNRKYEEPFFPPENKIKALKHNDYYSWNGEKMDEKYVQFIKKYKNGCNAFLTQEHFNMFSQDK